MRLKTPPAILSFPHIFEPQPPMNPGEKAKYSAALVFLEETDISSLVNAVQEVGEAKWGSKFAGMVKQGQVRTPFNMNWEAKGYPENSVFINVRTERRPGVASIYPDPDNPRIPKLISEEEANDPDSPFAIYPGVIVLASLTCYAYDNPRGGKGVTFGLNNLQKLRDGDRLDSFVSAEYDFDADPDAIVELEEMPNAQDEEDEPEEEMKPAKATKTKATSKAAAKSDPLKDLIGKK